MCATARSRAWSRSAPSSTSAASRAWSTSRRSRTSAWPIPPTCCAKAQTVKVKVLEIQNLGRRAQRAHQPVDQGPGQRSLAVDGRLARAPGATYRPRHAAGRLRRVRGTAAGHRGTDPHLRAGQPAHRAPARSGQRGRGDHRARAGRRPEPAAHFAVAQAGRRITTANEPGTPAGPGNHEGRCPRGGGPCLSGTMPRAPRRARQATRLATQLVTASAMTMAAKPLPRPCGRAQSTGAGWHAARSGGTPEGRQHGRWRRARLPNRPTPPKPPVAASPSAACPAGTPAKPRFRLPGQAAAPGSPLQVDAVAGAPAADARNRAARARKPDRVIFQTLRRQAAGLTESGDAGHVRRAGPQAPLLAAAELQRRRARHAGRDGARTGHPRPSARAACAPTPPAAPMPSRVTSTGMRPDRLGAVARTAALRARDRVRPIRATGCTRADLVLRRQAADQPRVRPPAPRPPPPGSTTPEASTGTRVTRQPAASSRPAARPPPRARTGWSRCAREPGHAAASPRTARLSASVAPAGEDDLAGRGLDEGRDLLAGRPRRPWRRPSRRHAALAGLPKWSRATRCITSSTAGIGRRRGVVVQVDAACARPWLPYLARPARAARPLSG